jgi:hypothetical protein
VSTLHLGKVASAVLAHMREIDRPFVPLTRRDEKAADTLVALGLATCEEYESTVHFNGGHLTTTSRRYRLAEAGGKVSQLPS